MLMAFITGVRWYTVKKVSQWKPRRSPREQQGKLWLLCFPNVQVLCTGHKSVVYHSLSSGQSVQPLQLKTLGTVVNIPVGGHHTKMSPSRKSCLGIKNWNSCNAIVIKLYKYGGGSGTWSRRFSRQDLDNVTLYKEPEMLHCIRKL